MDVTAEHVARVPAANLRIPRELFGQMWELVEWSSGTDSDYRLGVLFCCRWLACQPFTFGRDDRFDRWALSPFRRSDERAMPETIEAEYLAAVRAEARIPRPRGDADPGDGGARERARATVATLRFSWCGYDHPPIGIPRYYLDWNPAAAL